MVAQRQRNIYSRIYKLKLALILSLFVLSCPVYAADFSAKSVGGYKIVDSSSIQKFYAENKGELIWVDGRRLTSDAKEIIADMGKAWEQGLNPENYHYVALTSLAKNGIPEGREVESEILLSDAVIRYGQDLSGMRLSPRELGEDPNSWSRGIDGYSLLSLLSQKSDPADFLNQLAPQDETYLALKKKLKDIAEDLAKNPETNTKQIAFPGTLKPGMQHPAIVAIRRQLGDNKNSDVYDDGLKSKVQDFQRAHGLASDGLIGPRSFDAINQTRTKKLIKLIANLERRRWVRRPIPPRYVAVNIPQMELKAFENSKLAFEMPVIVGREKRQTMSFVDEIVGIRFNPLWYVPDTIKNEDYLPQLQKDPNALNDHHIKFRVKEEDGGYRPVSSADIDWSTVDAAGLKNIQMFQDSGEDNALGTIRVLMPNRYDIYLHDTNAPNLFTKDDRALSSGCVRMSEPRRMANFILGANRDWSNDRMDAYLAKGKLVEVKAEFPVPVYLFYYTAWLDKNDDIVIANDLYGADTKLVQTLQKAGKIPFELRSRQ